MVLVIVDGGCVTDVIADGDVLVEVIVKDLDNLGCDPAAARCLAATYGRDPRLSPRFRRILLDGLPQAPPQQADDGGGPSHSTAAAPIDPAATIPEIASLTDVQARAILSAIFQWLYCNRDGSFAADKVVSGADTVEFLLAIMPRPGDRRD